MAQIIIRKNIHEDFLLDIVSHTQLRRVVIPWIMEDDYIRAM